MYDKETKDTLNSLKCPICGGLVDLLDWLTSAPKAYNFCCAADEQHYRIWFPHWDKPLVIRRETVIVYDGKWQYTIDQRRSDLMPLSIPMEMTSIIICEVDAEKRIVQPKDLLSYKSFKFHKLLFDFSQTNLEKILNRIKTIVVFS